MTIFVAEINGKGIVAFNQPSPEHALTWADDEDFRSDLIFLEGQNGRPRNHALAIAAPERSRTTPSIRSRTSRR